MWYFSSLLACLGPHQPSTVIQRPEIPAKLFFYAELSVPGSLAELTAQQVLLGALVGRCCPYIHSKTPPGHEFPACQHATHDLMATIPRQKSECDVNTMSTKFGWNLRSLDQCGGLVWPQTRQKTAEIPHFSSILRLKINFHDQDPQ